MLLHSKLDSYRRCGLRCRVKYRYLRHLIDQFDSIALSIWKQRRPEDRWLWTASKRPAVNGTTYNFFMFRPPSVQSRFRTLIPLRYIQTMKNYPTLDHARRDISSTLLPSEFEFFSHPDARDARMVRDVTYDPPTTRPEHFRLRFMRNDA